MKMPKTLGACVDLAYQIRADRLEIERKVDAMKKEEKELEEHIFQTFAKADIDKAGGTIATAAITRTVVPNVTDWDQFYKYIMKTKSLDLLERRPSRSAFRERLDAGETVPGVEAFERIGLSLTKR